MSHLPADAHRRLERTCASGCTATAICPPGRCVKAGRASLSSLRGMAAMPEGCTAEGMVDAARAAWAAAVPPGWKLVPVDPTEAMVDATHHGQPVDDIYRDMLDAAPIPPAALLPAERACCGTFEGSEHRSACEAQPLPDDAEAERDHVEQELAAAHAAPRVQWPAGRDAGRAEDMGIGHLRVVLDSDNDACVEVWDGERSASVEFCNPGGGGGGRSSRTRMALIALMVAIEADNAERPDLQRPYREPAQQAKG